MSNAIAVAATDTHMMILQVDGSLWTFGDNSAGELGRTTKAATTTPNPAPTQAMTGILFPGFVPPAPPPPPIVPPLPTPLPPAAGRAHAGQAVSVATGGTPGGHQVSMRIRKRTEEPFGWMKTVAGGRKLRYIGRERNRAWFKMTGAVYNLVRIAALDNLA